MIGIDAGKDNTGFAVWDAAEKEWLDITTTSFWPAFYRTVNIYKGEASKLVVYVEDPSGNNPVWFKGKGGKKTKKNRRKSLNIAQKVGMNKREAELMIEGLRLEGILVIPITPKQSKLDAKTFKKVAGYDGSTSEHSRDAAMLVAGRTAIPDLQWERLQEQYS